MTLIQTQKSAVYLAAAAALASVFSSSEIHLPFEVAVGLAFAASWFFGDWAAGKGTTVWNAAVIATIGFLAVEVAVGMMDIVLAATYFAILLLINRLYNRRTPREHAQLHLMMLLTISGGAILSADLGFGVSFLIFCVAATWSLTLSLLRAEIEDEARANGVPDGGLSVLQSSRVISGRFLALLSSLALGAVAAAVIVFILFPRVSFGIFSRKGVNNSPRVGYTGHVELGEQGMLKDDARVALRVFSAGNKGGSLYYYWRGATMDVYDGKAWHDSTHRTHQMLGQQHFVFPDREDAAPGHDKAAEKLRVELVPDSGTTALFTTGELHWLGLIPRKQFPPVPPLRLTQNDFGDLQYRPVQQTEFQYEMNTSPERERNLRGLGRDYPFSFNHPLATAEEIRTETREPDREPDLQRFTQLPASLSPRVLELGKKLAAGKDPSEAVTSVVRYLAPFIYSQDMKASGPDPLSSFLFDVKSGQCEYFATALAVLLRAGGVPSRIVMGYYGGKYIANGDYYAVREGDAHAWVEVYFPHVGWRTFDATPVQGREAFVNEVYAAVSLWVDGLRTQWRNLVVEYDLGTQVRAFQGIIRVANDLSNRLSSQTHVSSLRKAGVRLLWLLAFVVACIAAVIVVPLLWRRFYRPPLESAAAESQSRRLAARLARELLTRLARKGLVRKPSQTLTEFAREMGNLPADQAIVVGRVIDRYVEARYGRRPLDAAEAGELRRELRRI